MYCLTPATGTAKLYGYSILIGAGAGATSTSTHSIAAAKIEEDVVPDAIALMNVAQIGAVVRALAISGTIFQSAAFKNLETTFAGL